MNWVLLKNSLVVSGAAAALAVAAGFAAALFAQGLPRRGRNLVVALSALALAMPPFLVTNCWLDYFGAAGPWRAWVPFGIMSLPGTVWILALLLWPIPFLAACSAWHRLEPAQLESDSAVAGTWLMRGVLLPLARGPLTFAAVLVFVLALNNFAVPAILQVKVAPAEMWVRFNTTFDTWGALRMSLPLMAGPLALVLLLFRTPPPWPHFQSAVSPRRFRAQLGRPWFWTAGAVVVPLAGVSTGLPVFQLLSVKRTWTELPGALAAGQGSIINSLLYAGIAATLVVLVSAALARTGKGSALAGRVLWLPFLIPGVILGIVLIGAFNRPWAFFFYQSSGIVVLAFFLRYLVLGWTGALHAANSLDRDLSDAAELMRVRGWRKFRHVYWPQAAPSLLAAWYVVFLLCLWDVESMILIVPPGGETLAVRIFNLLHYGHNAQVNALCLTLLLLAIAPLIAWKAVALGRFARAGALVAGLALLGGCGPKAESGMTPIDSKLFKSVQVIGSRGVGVGQLNKPRSVAVDGQDNLYVVDMTGRVQKFSSNGVFASSWQMPQTDLGRPKGMGRDHEGNVIVVEPHYQRINFFSPNGKLVEQWGRRGTNAGELMMPRAVAVDSRDRLFVSEYGLVERVQVFNIHGGPGKTASQLAAGSTNYWSAPFVATFGRPGTGPGEFNRPEGLGIDAQDRLYVADSCNHRIQVFSADGTFLRAHGQAGKGVGDFSYPYDVQIDAAGRQFVCEFGNSRIQIFDGHDQPLEVLGGPGADPGKFNDPWGIALDSRGNLYVADSQNHRVQKFIRR
jgi:ABC-type Fe3+ transport system permease subunit/DNA-binding beta-propeller fold protein YncE